MSFLVSFFCLFLTCTATPPVIVHTPAPIVEPKEFTIESVGIAEPAKSMQKKQNLGTIALGATIEQLLAQEESLFAEIDKDGTVLRVIVIDQATLNTGKWGDPKNWVQTSAKGTVRKNYAGIGYTYDKTRDAFIPPKPEGAMVFDEAKAWWISPITPCWMGTTTPCSAI